MATVATWSFRLLALLIGLASLRFLVAPLDLVMDHVLHYLDGQRLALYVHITLGPLALLLAPLQLSRGVRRRWPRLHRIGGRSYAVTCLAAGVAALALLPGYAGDRWSATGFAVLALLWIGFTAAGIAAIRAGRIADHRRWMVRSVAMTSAAISLRLIMAPLLASGWALTDTYRITAWASWIVTWIIAELWLRRPVALAAA